jgi:hypothetical protein
MIFSVKFHLVAVEIEYLNKWNMKSSYTLSSFSELNFSPFLILLTYHLHAIPP